MTRLPNRQTGVNKSRMRLLMSLLLLGLLLYLPYRVAVAVVQDKPATKAEEAKPIPIAGDLYNLIKIKELELRNLELEVRLILQVPNDYVRQGDKYIKPPQVQPPKVEKNEKPKPSP